MAKLSAKGRRSSTRGLSNVIDLDAYRRTHGLGGGYSLLYVSQNGRCRELLESFAFLTVHALTAPPDRSGGVLERAAVVAPDVVLIDSDLRWANPMDLIEEFQNHFSLPIVLLCHRSQRQSQRKIKEAYQAGATDILFTPFAREDLFEMLEVLLKFQRQATFSN